MKAKDPAFAAPSRLLVAALLSLMVIMGVLILVVGAALAAIGFVESWIMIAIGLICMVIGVVSVTAMLPTRHPPGPAVEIDGGVALPLRRGYARRQALLAVSTGLALLPSIVLHDHQGFLMIGGPVLVIALVLRALWFLFRGADLLRIKLTPAGLVWPLPCGMHCVLPWDQIKRAQALPRWQPVLVVKLKEGKVAPGRVKLLAQGWSPTTLTKVIEHYTEHPDLRSDLTCAAAVEAVAFGAATPIAPGARR